MGTRLPLKGAVRSGDADTGLIPAEAEALLVARVRAGDVAAFHIVFRHYYASLCAFVASYVRSDAIAEERVQDVLMRVWVHRADLVVHGGLRQYLYGAVRNEALNVLKRRRVESHWQALAERELRETGMGQGPAAPEDRMAAVQLSATVDRVLARQPERRREAFLLRCRHRLTNPEIAAVMGISVKGVEAIMRKVLDALREELTREE